MNKPDEDHSHYYRTIRVVVGMGGGVVDIKIDFYRICELFGITSAPQQHALKKIMFAGRRPDEPVEKDIREAMQTLDRWLEMKSEGNLSGSGEQKTHDFTHSLVNHSICKICGWPIESNFHTPK